MESLAKEMIDSIIAYSPDGLHTTPEDMIKSYWGEKYLKRFIESCGEKQIKTMIKERQERIDYLTPLNEDGYRSIHLKKEAIQ